VFVAAVDTHPSEPEAPPGRIGMGETRREEWSGFARLLWLSACTNAESLELSRASSMFLRRGFSSKSQRIGEGLLATDRGCRIKTHGFIVCFAETGC
jgi:hypothetical protein